jgi:pyruvate/2-oxoacid:ferredoxin oxidoreductase beta subunit
MDQPTAAATAARRNEDIALDLLKFVVTSTGVVRSGSTATGFVAATAPKPEDHVQQLLALYSRCLRVVEGKGDSN